MKTRGSRRLLAGLATAALCSAWASAPKAARDVVEEIRAEAMRRSRVME